MIKIIAGGKKNNGWVLEACNEYEKRLKKPFVVEWQFCDEDRLESKVLALPPSDYVILLDEHGEILDSPSVSKKISSAFENGSNVTIVIGGAFGHFSDELFRRANLVWSFSKLVFPHQICRTILLEQIYRSQEIYLGHPYHHA